MSDMDEFDVIVAGGGLAGCAAAIGAAEKGLSALVLESRTKDRIENADTSFEALQNLTRREDALEHLRSYGIDLKPEYPYKGAIIHGPGGSTVDFRLNRYHGYFVRRGGMGSIDDQMLKKVERTPTVIAYSSRVTGIDPDGTVSYIRNGHSIKVKGRTIIGADGIGTVAGAGIVQRLKKKDIATGIGYHFSGSHGFEPGIAECWLGSELCPGEYAYVLPSENEVSVVTTMRPHLVKKRMGPSDHLERFLSIPQIEQGLNGTRKISRILGSVPVRPGRILGRGRVLLVGEAARLTDPLLGFGIGNAIVSGTIAGKSASMEDPLSTYKRSEVRSMIRDNERRYHVRNKKVDMLSDDRIDRLLDSISIVLNNVDPNGFFDPYLRNGSIISALRILGRERILMETLTGLLQIVASNYSFDRVLSPNQSLDRFKGSAGDVLSRIGLSGSTWTRRWPDVPWIERNRRDGPSWP